MTNYNLVLKNPVGESIQIITNAVEIDFARSLNTIGNGTFSFAEDPYHYGKDYRIEVWRKSRSGAFYLEGETFWLVTDITRTFLPNGRWRTSFACQDTISILDRRIVDFPRGTDYADKLIINGNTGYEDDLMKEFVRENLGPNSEILVSGRNIPTLSIEGNLGQGATEEAEKQAAFRKVLSILQELAQESHEAGVPLYFDVEADEAGNIIFKTYAHYRGTDHTADTSSPVILTDTSGNLSDLVLRHDYTSEINAVTVGGFGEEAGRELVYVEDASRIAISPFNRMESFHDARDWEEITILTAEGRMRLAAGTPKMYLSATAIDTRDLEYGLHYRYGDLVTAVAAGIQFDCHVDAVSIRVQNGKEDLGIRLKGEIVL